MKLSDKEVFAEDDEFLIERRKHPIWLEWKSMPERIKTGPVLSKPILGEWQYLVSSKDKRWLSIEDHHPVSVIEMPNYLMNGETLWECCRTISRHNTLEEAIQQAKEFLRQEIRDGALITDD